MAKKKGSTRQSAQISVPLSLESGVWLRFIQLPAFESAWRDLGLEDEDLRTLELLIMANPVGPPIEPGTGGLRKIRFAPKRWGKGKRGGVRICYAYFQSRGIVLLIAAYRKNHKETLSGKEKTTIKLLIQDIERCFEQGAPF